MAMYHLTTWNAMGLQTSREETWHVCTVQYAVIDGVGLNACPFESYQEAKVQNFYFIQTLAKMEITSDLLCLRILYKQNWIK